MFLRRPRHAMIVAAPRTAPGWVSSPGGWVAPEEMRAGSDWVPEGGATERIDRMPRWARLWSMQPLRGVGNFDGWLWDHGGYDVEGPEAVTQREIRNERHAIAEAATSSATLTALDGTGPWPTRSTTRTGPVTVVDVGSFGDYAVVLAATDGEQWPTGAPMLENWVFHRDAGSWTRLGGGASGSGTDPLLARDPWHPENRPLQWTAGGGTNLEPEKRRGRWVRQAEVLCAPHVARVEIDRSNQRRVADTSSGPGWIVALWLKGSEPTLTAYDAEGRQVDVLRPESYERELASRGRSRRPRRPDQHGE